MEQTRYKIYVKAPGQRGYVSGGSFPSWWTPRAGEYVRVGRNRHKIEEVEYDFDSEQVMLYCE